MKITRIPIWQYICMCILCAILACNTSPIKETEIVEEPEDLNEVTQEHIAALLAYAATNNGAINDSVFLSSPLLVTNKYQQENGKRIWSNEQQFSQIADSLFNFVQNSELYGLFPEHYNYGIVKQIREKMVSDSLAPSDAVLWAKADILLTDAFFGLVHDLKRGRLAYDSISLRKDTLLTDSVYHAVWQHIQAEKSVSAALQQLEPANRFYHELKSALPALIDTLKRVHFTFVSYPYTDTSLFTQQLSQRLFEAGYTEELQDGSDSVALAEIILQYQKNNKLTADGKAGPEVVHSLNNTDWEKFVTIAINLDRLKIMLPDSLPEKFALVNIPAFNLDVWENDTLQMESRIIVGHPKTPTPVLNSNITRFIIFPQWTVPYSIIFGEMLPKIQKDVNYLAKQNLMVVGKNDSIIDPHTIDWSKLNKNRFPYLLKQREGDDNSLGVIKFDFANKYSVYLHDTNSRGLFKRTNRAMSHGCVRVQDWSEFYKYLIKTDTIKNSADSMQAWMNRREKRTVRFNPRLPLYIRYFTCTTQYGETIFHPDVYGEDAIARNYILRNKKNSTSL